MNFEGHWSATASEGENRYQYNGKELTKDLGLGWYFYGAKMHDPAVGRFTGVDPKAEKFAWVTGYNYAENEPVGHVDLWGLQKVKAINGDINVMEDDLPTATVTAPHPTRWMQTGTGYGLSVGTPLRSNYADVFAIGVNFAVAPIVSPLVVPLMSGGMEAGVMRLH